MSYTKTPTTDTFSQENVQLSRDMTSRQNDPMNLKDEGLVNCIVEIIKDKRINDSRTFHYKRAGASTFISSVGDIRGSYMWVDKGLFVYSVGTNVFLYNVNTNSTVTCSGVFTAGSTPVGFELFLYSTGTALLVATDGTKLVTITDTGTVAVCVDADLPTPHNPQPVFLDGYLFLIETDTAYLWNSDLDNPLLWTAGNFIMTEISGDIAKEVSRLNNYLVVFGSKTIEYFYDAGEVSGSPLKRNDTPVKLNGFIGGVGYAGNAIYFLGYNESQQPDVFKLQDFTIEPVSNETIRRYFSASGNTLSSYKGFIVSNLGHDFYLLNGNQRCFVYDLKEKLWGRWQWKIGNGFQMTYANTLVYNSGVTSVFSVNGETSIFKFDDTVYQDDGISFGWQAITEPADFGTMNRKSMSKLSIVCDRPSGDSYMTVYVSDDDFQSFYGEWTVNMNQDLPSITRLGNFRQRAFKLYHRDNYPVRVQNLQVVINKGRN